MMNQKKFKSIFLGLIATLVFSMALSVNVAKAFDFITEQGIFKNLTPSEFLQIQAGNQPSEQAAGAIIMQEGQRSAVTDFVPDNNNEDSLGGYDRAFKNGYVSSTLFVGSNTDETVTTSTFTKLSVGNGDADFLVNSRTVCLSNGANCTGVSTAAFWTYDQAIPGWYRASSTPEKQGLGTATPDAQLEIEGDQDIVQLNVEGHTTQTKDTLQVRTSGGAPVFTVSNPGHVGVSGTMRVDGHILPGTNNLTDLGQATSSFRHIYASGTLYLAGTGASTTNIGPIAANTYDLGWFSVGAWRNVFSSGTI